VDGDLTKKFYEEAMADMANEDFTQKDYQGEYRDELNEAIKAQYGESAYLGENGQVHYQKDGEDATITLTNE
jgi:hypothetical protein